MFKRIKVKLYPTIKQKEMLDRHFNGYRFAYNLCLDYRKQLWDMRKISISGYDMQNELFQIRKESEWLSKCKAECIRDAALNVDKSFKSFFKGNGYPNFKSKNSEQSFSAYQSIGCKLNKLSFYKNKIKYKTSDKYNCILENNKIKQVTFKKDKVGDYFATCLVDIEHDKWVNKSDSIVGIDLGIKDLAITSDGKVYPNNKYLISARFKLRHFQRKFAKSKKGGKNRAKLRIKIAKIHRKITRQKEYFYHQITNEIIRDNQTIVIETLKVKNMMKNHKLARNISDASWSTFVGMLEYKANWNGRKLIKIDTFFPSSKKCSGCGNVKQRLLLSERIYNCECCGLSIDRDKNAAINIRNQGIKIPGLSV